MRRVACGSITTDGSQRDLTGKMGTHGQLLCSSTLSSSLFSEAVSFQAPTLPSTQPSLTSSLSWHVTWLPYKKQPEGNALHFINCIATLQRPFIPLQETSLQWFQTSSDERWANSTDEETSSASLNIICFCFCLPARGDRAAEVEMELGGITIKEVKL